MILKKKQLQQQLNRYYSTNSPCKELNSFIGLEKNEFIRWVEKQFVLDMKRENYGLIWQLDHVLPAHLFDFNNYDDVKLCFHYLNVLPLLNDDNKFKSASIHFSKLVIEKRIREYGNNQILSELLRRCDLEIENRWNKYQ